MNVNQIGRLLRANNTGFVIGCRVSQHSIPSFGALVRVPLDDDYQVYGLIHNIHIDDDGLVKQLVTAEGIDETVIQDNRLNRNVPLEISVLSVGYQHGDQILHLLPPRPPLSLDQIFLCPDEEICHFTSSGRFGYLRHILRHSDLPVGELLAAHVHQANQAHLRRGQTGWAQQVTRELITLLRDDYPTLMSVLGALGDALPDDKV